MGILRRLATPIVLVAALACADSTVSGATSVADESRVKAAFVAKFPQFVEWPPVSWVGRATVDICVASPDVADELRPLVAGEHLGPRALNIRLTGTADDVATCHVLFVPGPRTPETAGLLQRAATLPVLTVGDGEAFLDQGGIIALRTVDGRVRFAISLDAATRAELRVSAHLLRLAVAVRERRS